MSTKTISTDYSKGFSLTSPVTALYITATGTVGGSGVVSGTHAAYTIHNAGVVHATGKHFGIDLRDGGQVFNSTAGKITGYYGIVFDAPGVVGNTGTIIGTGAAGAGIGMAMGGSVNNGNATDFTALITGKVFGIGVHGPGTVTNFGKIEATGTGAQVSGIGLEGGGFVTNGSASDTKALIQGEVFGIGVTNAAGHVSNFGTVKGLATGIAASGIGFNDGGAVTNGSTADHKALISGAVYGVGITAGAGTVVNFGTIVDIAADGPRAAGVGLAAGGSVTNGSTAGGVALIEGQLFGIIVAAGVGTVANFGSILTLGATTGEAGIALDGGGRVTNGTTADKTATISGLEFGVSVSASGTVTNFGTIKAGGTAAADTGVALLAGGRLTNGSATDAAASISGVTGVAITGNGTIADYGKIKGTGGTAVKFSNAADLLIDEGSASFTGKVVGGDGTLELAGGAGAGTLTGLGTSFSGFGSVVVATGATWTLAGAAAPGTAGLHVNGKLTIAGTLSESGTLTNIGTIVEQGAIVLNLAAGADLSSGATASVFDITGNGGIAVTGVGAAAPLFNAGTLEKTGGTGTSVIDLSVLNAGKVSVTSGTLDIAGVLSGSGVSSIGAGATLELGSTVANTGTIDFAGAKGNLVLGAGAVFKATVKDFASGDTIKLSGFDTGTTIAFSGSVLTVTDGAQIAKINLFGQYVAGGFKATAGASGTVITYKTPPAPITLAASH